MMYLVNKKDLVDQVLLQKKIKKKT